MTGAPPAVGARLWTYRRPFLVDGLPAEVVVRSAFNGLHSELRLDGRTADRDWTPAAGQAATRNHRLRAPLPDGRGLDVEMGYVNWLTVGIAARVEGRPVHESHPGRRLAYPASAARMARDPGYDPDVYRRNRAPIIVDVLLGLLFYVVAKLTDLPTAAIVGAAVGFGLLVVQRFVKMDLIGGLALFGVVMLLLSAALAILFQDDWAVKMRSTILGSLSAALFLGDGLFFRGRLLAGRLARYLPYTDIDPGRLGIGLGLLGLLMAGLNYGVATAFSTDVWLFYSTFGDFFLVMLLTLLVFKYARSGGATA